MTDVGTVVLGREAFDAEKALARLAYEMADPPFHDVLRPQPVRVDEGGSVVVRLAYRPEFCGRRGGNFFHGGVIAALVDMTAHAAIAVRIGRMAPTIDLRIDYLRTANAGDLLATGRILSAGRSLGRADVEIRGEDGKVVAVGRGAFSTREG